MPKKTGSGTAAESSTPMLPFPPRDAIVIRAPRPFLPEVDVRRLPRKPQDKKK